MVARKRRKKKIEVGTFREQDSHSELLAGKMRNKEIEVGTYAKFLAGNFKKREGTRLGVRGI